MKKLILTFGIFLAGIFFVNAQNNSAPSASKMMSHLTTVCGLNPEQVAKIKPLAEAVVKAHQDNKQKFANDPAGMKNANKSVNESFKTQLKVILTPDQLAKLKADRAQMTKTSSISPPKAAGK